MKNTEPPVAKKPAAESFTLMANPDPGSAVPGDLVIHENAVSSIIRRVVEGIPGVSRLTGSSFVDNIAEIVRSRKMQDRAITLQFSEDSVAVDISLYVYSGAVIPEVAASLQKAVIDTVFSLTGLRVTGVDVSVRGIDEVPAASAEETEQSEKESAK